MKTNKLIIPALAGILFASTAFAVDVDITMTGSTAFRSIVLDRTKAMFDAGYTSLSGGGATDGTVPITYVGTMSQYFTPTNTTVAVRLSFSGSGTGIIAVDGSTPVSTRHPVTGNLSNAVPDVAFSDIFPESTTPPVNGANLERSVIGVIPFVFVKNNALTGINNLTKEQATLLFTASGVQSGLNGMPANFLGGADANPIYFTGRDSGSGTRISVHKDVGFTGTPVMWSTNNAGGYIQTAGFSSGGTERNTIANGSRVIGYLGEADALTIASSATVLTYNGVAFSHNNVATGKYPIWGYENVVNRVGGLSANQGAFRDALLSNCTYSAYQNTAIYSNAFVPLSDMQVERGTDGGTITSLNF